MKTSNFVLVPLADLGNWVGGGTPSKLNPAFWENGTIPWVSPKDMKTDHIRAAEDYITELAVKESTTNQVPAGSILVVTRSGILRHTLPAAIADVPVTINQDLKALALKPEIDPKYVAFALRTFNREILNQCSKQGTTVNSIETQKLLRFQIPLTSYSHQTRIVAEIEKQFSRLDEAVANLKRIKANLKRYKAAVLKAAIAGKLTDGAWKAMALAVDSIDQGWSPLCDREPSASEVDWGVIKTTAIQPQTYLDDENKRLPKALEPRAALEIQCGDLLITRAGPRGRVGVSCLVRKTRPKLMICDKVYRLRCNRKICTPEFLELVLNAPQIVKGLDELKTGISDSGVNLTQGRFLAMEIPLPTVEIQRTIVADTERRISILSDLESEFDANLRRAERLRQSILKQAFSGQLVPPDPNDEPASVLLERIRANANVGARHSVPKTRTKPQQSKRTQHAAPLRENKPAPAAPDDFTSLDSVLAAILDRMQPGREYSRADIADPLGLTTTKWNTAIQELKRRGRVRQVGERRGARYIL